MGFESRIGNDDLLLRGRPLPVNQTSRCIFSTQREEHGPVQALNKI